jgi:hypothetical protein
VTVKSKKGGLNFLSALSVNVFMFFLMIQIVKKRKKLCPLFRHKKRRLRRLFCCKSAYAAGSGAIFAAGAEFHCGWIGKKRTEHLPESVCSPALI